MKNIIVLVAILFAMNAHAETLDAVESEVFQTLGTPQEIATKGKTCLAQLLRGDSDASPITDADIQAGTIIARSQFKYTFNLVSGVLRSTVTFMAKDGRFKITNSNIDRILSGYGATPIYKGWGTGWKASEQALIDQNMQIAQCVMKFDQAKSNW